LLFRLFAAAFALLGLSGLLHLDPVSSNFDAAGAIAGPLAVIGLLLLLVVFASTLLRS
jgi:hypothetical protein